MVRELAANIWEKDWSSCTNVVNHELFVFMKAFRSLFTDNQPRGVAAAPHKYIIPLIDHKESFQQALFVGASSDRADIWHSDYIKKLSEIHFEAITWLCG